MVDEGWLSHFPEQPGANPSVVLLVEREEAAKLPMGSVAGGPVVLNHNDRLGNGFFTIREHQFDYVTDNKLVSADWFAVLLNSDQRVNVLSTHV